MELPLIASAVMIGFLCAFLSSAISSLSQEKLNEILDSKAKNATKLQKLKLHYEESEHAFFLTEAFLYSIALPGLGYEIFKSGMDIYIIIILLILIFLFILFSRTIFVGLGNRYGNSVALKLTPLTSLIQLISSPVNNIIIKLLKKISGKNLEEASRDELNAMFDTAHEEGSIEADEYRILKNIMHFSEVFVSDVMTPRTMVFSCHADKTVSELVNVPEIKMYSRFPLREGESLDDGIVGYVMSKDILYAALNGQLDKKVRDFSREVYIIPENAELDKALEQFLQRRQHVSVVVDEYGGVEGLLTMEDVLETILGVEIVDEADKVVDLREAAKIRRDKRIASRVFDKPEINI